MNLTRVSSFLSWQLLIRIFSGGKYFQTIYTGDHFKVRVLAYVITFCLKAVEYSLVKSKVKCLFSFTIAEFSTIDFSCFESSSIFSIISSTVRYE